MFDKIITLNDQKGAARRGSDQAPTPISARLRWMADLVCAILNAEKNKRPSSMAGGSAGHHLTGE
jgi:hypothetical protein